MSGKALEGVRVIEIAEMVSGPYCAKILADMGAEVIKVEAPKDGDPSRKRPPFPDNVADPEKSGLFLYLNTNKLGITLNWGVEEGKKALYKLLDSADILVSDKQPDELKRLNIDYNELLEMYPSLIITSITPFGLTGPYSNYKAYSLNIAHAGGQGYTLPRYPLTPGRAPVKPGGNSVSYDSGLGAALPTLAALFYQRLTKTGQLIDISEQEVQLDQVRVEAVTYANGGDPIERYRQEHLRGVGGNFPCIDGMINAAPGMDSNWKLFMDMLDNPDWSKTDMCKDPQSRADHYLEISDKIAELTANESKWDITEKGQSVKFPITPVLTIEEVAESKHFAEREFFREIEHPEIGKISKFPSAPYKMEKSPWAYYRSAPMLGEHNDKIYIERLGLKPEEMTRYRDSGIV